MCPGSGEASEDSGVGATGDVDRRPWRPGSCNRRSGPGRAQPAAAADDEDAGELAAPDPREPPAPAVPAPFDPAEELNAAEPPDSPEPPEPFEPPEPTVAELELRESVR